MQRLQVEELAKRFRELGRVRLVISNPDRKGAMTMHAECASPDADLKSKTAAALRDVTKLGGDVVFGCA